MKQRAKVVYMSTTIFKSPKPCEFYGALCLKIFILLSGTIISRFRIFFKTSMASVSSIMHMIMFSMNISFRVTKWRLRCVSTPAGKKNFVFLAFSGKLNVIAEMSQLTDLRWLGGINVIEDALEIQIKYVEDQMQWLFTRPQAYILMGFAYMIILRQNVFSVNDQRLVSII